jgi:adenylate cyclase
MIADIARSVLDIGARIGAHPGDSENVRLRKSMLVMSTVMFIVAGLLWGLMYFALGETTAGWIPFGYGLVSLVSLLGFAATGRYQFFRFSQLFLILLLPFLLMLALGGFINGSMVIVWAILCPMGALVFDEPHRAPAWFLSFVGLVILSGFLQPYLRQANALTGQEILLFFVLNVGVVSSFVFILLFTFVRQRNALLALVRTEQAKSENLLLNILPAEIAAILKNEERTIADYFPGASILFADMVWRKFARLAIATWWRLVFPARGPTTPRRWPGWRWPCAPISRPMRSASLANSTSGSASTRGRWSLA